MGVWGIHFDESDGAADFLSDVAETRAWSDVDAAITDYVENGGYDDADAAVVALELVAAAIGNPSPRLSPELVEWAKGHSADAVRIRERALVATELVIDASELSELWTEADEGEGWLATIVDLQDRLRS
jgi:hypothetical protein